MLCSKSSNNFFTLLIRCYLCLARHIFPLLGSNSLWYFPSYWVSTALHTWVTACTPWLLRARFFFLCCVGLLANNVLDNNILHPQYLVTYLGSTVLFSALGFLSTWDLGHIKINGRSECVIFLHWASFFKIIFLLDNGKFILLVAQGRKLDSLFYPNWYPNYLCQSTLTCMQNLATFPHVSPLIQIICHHVSWITD